MLPAENDRPARVLTNLMGALNADDIARASAILSRGRCEPRELLALLERHRLTGYFHVLVRNTPLEARFQGIEGVDLAAGYLQQAERAEKNLQLISSISDHFESASIPFITMKGLGQSQRFLGDIRHRYMWDLDILVQGRDLSSACEQAIACGLLPEEGLRISAGHRLLGIHAMEFRGEPGKLDIHIALRILPGISLDYEAIWGNAARMAIEGVTLPVLSDEDTLLAAALGLGADIQKGGHNLRKIWDIHLMLLHLDANLDWEAFFKRRGREGSRRLVLNVFAFVQYLVAAEKDWPRLSMAMAEQKDQLIIDSETKAWEVFERPRGHFANRVLFSRMVQVSAARYWLLWLLTSPVRYFYYGGKGKKLRARRKRPQTRR